MTTAWTSLTFWPGTSPDPRGDVLPTLYCYACERLVRRLRDLVDVQEAAHRIAVDRGYRLGPLFVEEDDSGQAMEALICAATSNRAGAAVAVPHRGHFVPLGWPDEWQQLLELVTGRPLVLTSPAP
ncbi:hypothetical protein [Kribbella sp. HUAS MG21]|jgi:hypothetical protein|uniref:Uncharacterized protein n=1 Tax=Kribbella sp. HUAS MG21 TaxID=3160966 RepID=A0AAU7TF18_9ACTN